MLSINRVAGYVLGIDLDYKHIQYVLSDLQGNAVYSDMIEHNTDDYDTIIQMLVEQIRKYENKSSNSPYGLISIVIGIHGMVDKEENILFVPKYQWYQKNLKNDLKKIINTQIYIENNANLSAFAEKVYKYHNNNNLLTIILTSGIGAGSVINSKIQKGYHGYAGEIGHMIICPEGKKCRCGNHGCWELYSSEPILFDQLRIELNKQNLTYQNIKTMIIKKDPTTYRYLERFIKFLSLGLNNIINSTNPETLVINSEILRLYPNSIQKIEGNLKSSISQYREIVLSNLGNKACVMGAYALAIQRFLGVPELVLHKQSMCENDTN